MNEKETIADIAAEIRRGERMFWSMKDCSAFADRIEAAAEREARAADRFYGNAAALREALEQAKRDHWYDMSPDLRNKIFAALAAPPRNYEREQAEASKAKCADLDALERACEKVLDGNTLKDVMLAKRRIREGGATK